MKKSPLILSAILTAAASVDLSAQTLYWDSNGNTNAGAGVTPTGTWGTSTFWNTDSTGLGASPTTAWVAGSPAVFSAGTDATTDFTVTLSSAQTASALTVEEGSVSLAGSGLTVGAGTVTVENGARLSIPSTLNLVATAGANLNLNGGTFRSTTNSAGATFADPDFTINIGAAGGTVESANTGTNSTIFAGTIRGPGNTLTKTGSGEFRYQGLGLPNTTFARLVVNQGLYRLGFSASISDERGFGAVPASFMADAITLSGGGSIGTSFLAANSVLHANRGITLGAGGGAINGSMTIPGAITGSGSLSHLTTGTLILNGNSDYTGSTIVTNGIVTVGNANALGSTIGNTQVSATGEIRFDGAATNFTINEPFQIAGGGANGSIFIQNGANPTISGPITLAGNSTVGVSGTGTATFNNAAAFTSLAGESLTLQGGAPSTGNGGTISGAINLGTGGLTKLQGGIWRLNGANTYSGATTISAGTLLVGGSITGTSGVAITGTLGGGGVITTAPAGNVSLLAAGRISPGASSVDSLEINVSGGGALSLTAGVTASATAALVYELDTPASSDIVTLTGGALDIGSGVLEFDDFAFTTLGGFANGDYVLVDGNNPIIGTLGANTVGSLGTFTGVLQFSPDGNDLILHVIPEPGSAVLLAAALMPLLRRRKR